MLKHWSNPPPPPEKTFPPLKRIWVSLPPLKIWARYRPSPSKKKLMRFTPNIQFTPKWEYAFSPFSFFKLYIHVLFLNQYNSFTIYVDWYSWSEHIYFKKIQYVSISCIIRSVRIKIDLWSIPLNKYEYY